MKLLQGNEAICEAALKAGLTFFAGYPITPASEIMHYLAKKDIEFIAAEDEIASIHMIIGASLAGAKVLTATSGPGFSLVQEGIGLAHMLESPLVIVNDQRVGPSTGMPTLPSQADLQQSHHGSHGDYYPIVFYPNSVEECYKYTLHAFNASEESLSPVILLNDGFIAQMYETINLEKIKIKIKNRKRLPLGNSNRHFTGLLSKDGILKTRDSAYYKVWIKKFKEKISKVANNYNFYEYIQNKKSDKLLIAYGITSRVILPLKERYSIFRPIRIFPMLENELKRISKKYKEIIVIEMNEGQYKKEVERVIKRDVKLISIQGGTISLEEIKKELK